MTERLLEEVREIVASQHDNSMKAILKEARCAAASYLI